MRALERDINGLNQNVYVFMAVCNYIEYTR